MRARQRTRGWAGCVEEGHGGGERSGQASVTCFRACERTTYVDQISRILPTRTTAPHPGDEPRLITYHHTLSLPLSLPLPTSIDTVIDTPSETLSPPSSCLTSATMAATNTSRLASGAHPYYPLEVEIVGYLANQWSTVKLLAIFSAGIAAIFSCTYAMVKRTRPNASRADYAAILWFVLCGCIHSFFEGYFAYNFRHMGGANDLFGQLWKEYALSDSRYLTQDAFVLCMETVTAVRTPGSRSTLSDGHEPRLTTRTGLLGPWLLPHRLPHLHRPPAPLPGPARRLARPVLRRRPLLRHFPV